MKKNIFIILILVLFVAACGTDSGNPEEVDTPPQSSIISDFIGGQICQKIATCFSTSLTECQSKLMSADNLTSELGVNTTVYPNLGLLLDKVADQTLQINTTHKSLCHTAISNLSCGDTLVQQAYDSSDIENLDNTYYLLQSSSYCSMMVE